MASQVFQISFVLFTICIHKCIGGATILDARPITLQNSGDNITLIWKNVDSPSKHDWLGIYMPSSSFDDQYIGYILLSSCTTWTTGTCTLQIPLINMRSSYNFRLFKVDFVNVTSSKINDTSIKYIELQSGTNATSENGTINESKNISIPIKPTKNKDQLPRISRKLTTSPTIQFSNYNEPTQIHISLVSNKSAIRIMFVTKDSIKSKVRYGGDQDELGNSMEATSLTYSQADMCGEPASSIGWRAPGYIHNVVIGGLNYGSRYYYQVGSNTGGWSLIYSFIAPNPYVDETNALIFGDMGTSIPYSTYQYTQNESKNTIKWLKRDLEEIGDKPSFISHIGDISYAQGYSWLWDSFFYQIQSIATRSPYHVCIGNHEYGWPSQPSTLNSSSYNTDGGGECGVPYSMKFNMPGNSSFSIGTSFPSIKNLYYSINVGVVHFLFYSSETNFQVGSNQFDFIAKDLRTVDRKRTPFVVFLGHRPLYTSDYASSLDIVTKKLIQTFEPLLIETKVTIVFSGHVHKYERTCPLQNYTCLQLLKRNITLPIYIIIGTGGANHQPIDNPLKDHSNTTIFPQPNWSLFRTFEWGYIRLHATKHLMTISYVGNHDGRVHDKIEIPSFNVLKAKTYIEPQQSFFDTASGKLLPCGRYENVLPFLFILTLGCGLGVAFTQWYMQSQALQHPWHPIH